MRAQRDEIHLRSIRASPPGTMRAQVTSPNRLPRGVGLRHDVGDAAASGQADSPEAGLGRAARRVPDRILDFPGTGRAEDGATDTTVACGKDRHEY